MEKIINSKSLKSYLFYLAKNYKFYFLSLFILAISASLFEISVHYKIKELIDAISSNQDANLHILLGLFIFYKLMQHGMFFISRLLNLKYMPEFVIRVTSDIYYKTINHSLSWFDSHLSGEISNKINSFQLSISAIIKNIFRSLVVMWAIIIGIIYLAKISYLSALIQLVFLLIYAPLIYILLKKQLKLQEKYEKSNQETIGIINDSISNIFCIKIVGNIANELKSKLTPTLIKRQKLDRKARRFDAYIVDNADTIMIVIMSVVQIYALAYLYKTHQITAGGFAFISMIMLKLHGDISVILEYILFNINPQIAQIKASYDFINERYDISDKKDAKILDKNVKGEIEFKKVNFAYFDGSKKILKDFDLKIQSGEKIGLVGYSGAGKSTLIKALLRYFDINSGEILIDGNKITDVTQESLRANISLIPQDLTMFHRSILENLQIAKHEANKDEIVEVCKKAQIHEDILKMKEGYNSIVGERGVKVSGGQRQRIAIARAILKDAPILILDEATSSLDSKTEKLIQESLNLLIKDKAKTVIAIAHRLSTLKNMDRIIVLDEGKIVEIGKHDELLSNDNSLYKKLWEFQQI